MLSLAGIDDGSWSSLSGKAVCATTVRQILPVKMKARNFHIPGFVEGSVSLCRNTHASFGIISLA
jgi:hypothetical protein